MRNTGTIIVIGAIVLVLGIVVFTRGGKPPVESGEEDQLSPQKGVTSKDTKSSENGDAQTAEESRRARVQERLERLRSDAEERKANPLAAEKRDLPQIPTPNQQQAEAKKDEDEEEPDPDDESLKQTILNDPDPEERATAVFMLSGAEDKDSMRVIMKALDDPDSEVRVAAVEALGDYSDEISPDVLTPALQDPDAEVRFEAIGVLGDMESPEALDKVRQALNDPDEDNRELAAGIIDMADDETDKPAAPAQPQPAANPGQSK